MRSDNDTSPGIAVETPRSKRATGAWLSHNWGKLIAAVVGILVVTFTVGGLIWKLSGEITDLRIRARQAEKERDIAASVRNSLQTSLIAAQVNQATLVETIDNVDKTLSTLVTEIKELRRDVANIRRRRR